MSGAAIRKTGVALQWDVYIHWPFPSEIPKADRDAGRCCTWTAYKGRGGSTRSCLYFETPDEAFEDASLTLELP